MSRFRLAVLGDFAVERDGVALSPPAGRVRVLLVSLALRPRGIVTVDDLVDELWGEQPPDAPRVTLRGCIKRLRRALDDSAESVIRSVRSGYRLMVDPEDVDVHRFRRLLEKATQSGESAVEIGLLDEALSLWRGQPLRDLDSEVLRREVVPALSEEHQHALHRRIELGLRRGEHSRFVPRLRNLVAREPLQEQFWAQLLLALYQMGRQAEALTEYQRCRESLVDALGVEPSPPLRALHQRMLTGSPEIQPPR